MNQKCKTCRNLRTFTVGDGYHEPRHMDSECLATDQIIKLESLMREVADEHNDEDAYGENPTDGMGDTKPCPFYLEWTTCEKHGLLEPPGGLCPSCDAEADEALYRDYQNGDT